ncbi:Uncharacterized protein HZ326_28644, partial [Fusarium oxysporum f. sp. albedinis]
MLQEWLRFLKKEVRVRDRKWDIITLSTPSSHKCPLSSSRGKEISQAQCSSDGSSISWLPDDDVRLMPGIEEIHIPYIFPRLRY